MSRSLRPLGEHEELAKLINTSLFTYSCNWLGEPAGDSRDRFSNRSDVPRFTRVPFDRSLLLLMVVRRSDWISAGIFGGLLEGLQNFSTFHFGPMWFRNCSERVDRNRSPPREDSTSLDQVTLPLLASIARASSLSACPVPSDSSM